MTTELDIFRKLDDAEINMRLEAMKDDFASIGLELTWHVDAERPNDRSANCVHIRDSEGAEQYHTIGRENFDTTSRLLQLESFYYHWKNKLPDYEINQKISNLVHNMVRFGYSLADGAEKAYRDGNGLPIVCPDGSTYTLYPTAKSLREMEMRLDRDETLQLLEIYVTKYDSRADIIIRDDCFFFRSGRYALRMDVFKHVFMHDYKRVIELRDKLN